VTIKQHHLVTQHISLSNISDNHLNQTNFASRLVYFSIILGRSVYLILNYEYKSAKQKILDAASILFYNDGITNTGINSITDKAQVAKMSLYNNFPTKSDLISCYIEARHQEWLELFEKGKFKFTHLLMAFSLFLMLTMIMQSLPMKKVLGAAAC
jgi:hypothetical protein